MRLCICVQKPTAVDLLFRSFRKPLKSGLFARKDEESRFQGMEETDVQEYIHTHISEEKKKRRINRLNKVKVGFYLDRKLVENFRALIQKKYGEYQKGLLSYEAEMALRNWIGLHTNAQSEILRNAPNPTPKVILVFSQVKEYLLKNYYFELKPGQQIPRIHLENAIVAVRGSDPRTIKRWLRAFHKMGLIKPVTSATWEIL